MGGNINEQELYLLEVWPSLVMAYLVNPVASDVINELIEHLQNPAWSRPLPDIYTDTLQSLLKPETELTSLPKEATEEATTNTVTAHIVPESIVEEDTLNFVPSWDELLTTPIDEPAALSDEQYFQQQDSSEPTLHESSLPEQASIILSETITESLSSDGLAGDDLLNTNNEADDIFDVNKDVSEIPYSQIQNSETSIPENINFTELPQQANQSFSDITREADASDASITHISETINEEDNTSTITDVGDNDVIENDAEINNAHEFVEIFYEPEALSFGESRFCRPSTAGNYRGS